MLFVGLIVLWQLGILGGGFGSVPKVTNTARGFGRIIVFDPSIKYSGNTLKFTILNRAGQTVENLEITLDGSECGQISDIPIENLSSGHTAFLKAICDKLSPGDSFTVDVYIDYDLTVTGKKVHHSEQGNLRGAAE